MTATRINHVSVHAVDMEESIRFYTEVFGMERLASPDFRQRVEWLRLGDQQLHLFLQDGTAPSFHHLALDVDDFERVYLKARELGVVADAFAATIRELPDGSVQMYIRDPAGNLVEVDWPDASTLDRSIVGEIPKLADAVPQSDEALKARLYSDRAGVRRPGAR